MRLERFAGVIGLQGGGQHRFLTMPAYPGPVKFCRFSPDGRLFATTSGDCTIRLWDVAEAKCLHVLKGERARWD